MAEYQPSTSWDDRTGERATCPMFVFYLQPGALCDAVDSRASQLHRWVKDCADRLQLHQTGGVYSNHFGRGSLMLKERAVDIIKAHLDDAITAEKNFEAHLRGLLREGDHSDPQVLFNEHIEQTQQQQERLIARLQALGGSPSAVKSLLVQLFSFSTTPVHGPTRRENGTHKI